MEVERLVRSRTAPVRLVERVRLIALAMQGQAVPTIAEQEHCSQETVRLWIKRFNEDGLDGLADKPRAGRPATYSPEQVGVVIATALTAPQTLGLPFGAWTLDRLVVYLGEQQDLPIKRSRIDDLLVAEGLRWRQEETW
ncbi:MAG: helix-turn-helix domain-containing protein, partial [Dehalococcoidia bacterium]